MRQGVGGVVWTTGPVSASPSAAEKHNASASGLIQGPAASGGSGSRRDGSTIDF